MPRDLAAHDCAAQMLARLPAYLQRRRWQELAAVIAAEIQELDDAIVAVVSQLDLDTATDGMLDLIGGEVGEARNGLGDADYRAAIRIRVAVNRSRGLPEEIIRVARDVLDDDTKAVTLTTLGVASASLLISGVTGTTQAEADRLTAYVRKTPSAGVRLDVVTSQVPDAQTFRFLPTDWESIIEVPAHGLLGSVGDNQWDGPFQLTTTGLLPAGLRLATDYWVTVVDADHLKLSRLFSEAVAEVFVDLGSVGIGVHTMSKTAETFRTASFTFADIAITDVIPADDTLEVSDSYPPWFGPVRFATTGTLPAPLAPDTDYWLYKDHDVAGTAYYKVGLSYSDVYTHGTFIDLADVGAGTHTIVDTSETSSIADEVPFSPSTFTVAPASSNGLGFAGTPATLDLSGLLGSGYDTVVGLRAFGATGEIGGETAAGVTLEFIADAGAPGVGTYDESAFPAITFTFKPGVTLITDFEAVIGGDASEYLFLASASNTASDLADPDDVFGPEPFTAGLGDDGGRLANVQ